MALVTALTAASAGTSLLGGTLGLTQGILGANSSKAIGNYQAAIADVNSAISEMNAKRAESEARRAGENSKQLGLAAQQSAQDQDFEAAAQLGDLAAGNAISGLSGRSQDLVMSTAQSFAGRDRERLVLAGMADALRERAKGDELSAEATALRTEAAGFAADSVIARSNARMDAVNSRVSGLSSFIEGTLGAGQSLLEGSQSAAVRHDFSRAREWFDRKFRSGK